VGIDRLLRLLERRQPADLAEWRLDMLRYLQALLGIRGGAIRPRDLTEAELARDPWAVNLITEVDRCEAARQPV
jgi:hypothetical protein